MGLHDLGKGDCAIAIVRQWKGIVRFEKAQLWKCVMGTWEKPHTYYNGHPKCFVGDTDPPSWQSFSRIRYVRG